MRKTFLEWLKTKDNKSLKNFTVIEYCTGDSGDLGRVAGNVFANSKEEAKEIYKKRFNISDSNIYFYDFI